MSFTKTIRYQKAQTAMLGFFAPIARLDFVLENQYYLIPSQEDCH